MITIGEKVRNLCKELSREQQMFLGGPPFSSEINKEIENFERYNKEGLPARKRISLGIPEFDNDNHIIGYQSTTIILDANPTMYEKEYLHLEQSLRYAQLKKIFVHPNHQGSNIAGIMLNESLGFADEFDIDWVTDVKTSNTRMIHFLAKHGIIEHYLWMTAKDTPMYRFQKSK